MTKILQVNFNMPLMKYAFWTWSTENDHKTNLRRKTEYCTMRRRGGIVCKSKEQRRPIWKPFWLFFIKEETGVTAFKIQTTVLWHAFHYGLNHDISLRKNVFFRQIIWFCVLCTAPPFFLIEIKVENLLKWKMPRLKNLKSEGNFLLYWVWWQCLCG